LEKEQPQGLWYTLAEVLGSKIITGKNPRILKAIRFTPVGVQVGMQPVRLNDVINVDPAIDDFFSRVIEERKRLDKNDDISLEDRKRLSLSLKILANSTSYGIFVELNPENVGKDVMVRVYSDCNFKTTAGWYEKPGRYFFPILGTFITSGAHLMLTLAQYEVERRGGVYAFMDTDSIAIVASQERSVVNGIDQKDQPFSIPVLPYSEVVDIVSKFKQLNPYDRSIIPGSVLKIEDENYPFKDGKRLGLDISRGQFFYATPEQMKDVEQLYCYAVSSKRYVLYNHIGDSLILRKASEHGLGMYLSPLTNDHTNEWIEKAWLIIASGLKIEYDDLIKKPALTRLTMTTPNLVRWTARYNQNVSGRDGYQKSIKPFSFLIHPVAEGFFNPQVERAPILVAPYANPETALMMGFVDLHEPEKAYRIHIDDDNSFFQSSNSQDGVLLQRVKSYADVLRQYPLRREAKLVTSDGMQCLRNSIGLLSHPSISISSIKYIGKETNMLDVRIAGLVPSEIEYLVVEPDEWETRLLPLLRSIPTHEVVEKTGLSRRQIIRLKQVKHHPRKETIEKIRIALINL
jgi:hypothetical protein